MSTQQIAGKFYWVKLKNEDIEEWQPGQFVGGDMWYLIWNKRHYDEYTLAREIEEVGPEIVMQNDKDSMTIPKEEYEKLIEDANMLAALEGAGVDNWQGYDMAIDLYNEMRKEE